MKKGKGVLLGHQHLLNSVSYNSENAATVAGHPVLAASIGSLAVVSPNNYRI
jgi:hypothetical protein